MIARVAVTIGGNCENCGSYDLELIGAEPPPPKPALALVAALPAPVL